MSDAHRTEICSDFIEPGYWAACSCGWESELFDDLSGARLAVTTHLADEAEADR